MTTPQRDYSSEIGDLAAALSEAQAEFSAIPKTADNPFFRSKYADLATVVGHTQPILAKHKLAVMQFPTIIDRPGFPHDGEPALTTWLTHASGQWVRDTMLLHAAKADPQGQGAAITYARRFAYMAILGVVADVDDDGNAATRAKQSEVAAAAEQSPADEARAGLAALCREAGLDTRAVARRFSDEYGTPIRKADAEVIEGFMSVIRDELAVDAAAEAELPMAGVGE